MAAKSDQLRMMAVIEASTKSYERQMKKLVKMTDDATKKAGKHVQKLDKRMSMLGSGLKVIGGAAGGFVAGRGILEVGSNALKTASDIEEMESKFDTVFRDLSGSADRWARQHANSVGRSQNDLKGYLATLQDTFVPLGFGRSEAAELSKTIAALGIDLASFNNQADADVIRNLTSAIVGNHEAVRSYGIMITEATLKQELMRQGYTGTVAAASNLAKVQARLAVIMRSTTDAQNDAARTAGSYANQQKALDAETEKLLATLGALLQGPASGYIAFLKDAARFTNEALGGLNEYEKVVSRLANNKAALKAITSGALSPDDDFGPGSYGTTRSRALEGEIKRLETIKRDVDRFRAVAEGSKKFAAAERERAAATRKAHEESKARIATVVTGLEKEIRLAKMSNVERKIASALEKAKITADSDEGRRIAALVREAHARQTAGKATTKQRDAVKELIADLEFERRIMGLSETDRRVAIALRQAGAAATDKQREKIEALVRAKAQEEIVTQELKKRQDQLNQSMHHFGNETLNVIDAIATNSQTASEAVAGLGRNLGFAAAQSALLGTGPLAHILGTASDTPGGVGGLFGAFAGMFADGGNIPRGQWGIVGEKGPEPVLGPATVLPNSSLRSGGMSSPIMISMSNDFRGVAAADQARINQQLEVVKREAIAGAVSAVRAERHGNPGYLPT